MQPPAAPPPAPYQSFGNPPASGWSPPPPVRPRRWWIWACGGCGALALVAIAVSVFVFVHIFTSSPLRQFPTESGASTARDNFTSTNDHTTETLQIVDGRAIADVETFYQQALRTNGWTTETHDAARAASGDAWTFSRTGSPTQSGTITFTTAGSGTDIAVVFNY
jgi:hypothetical protein